MLEEQKPKGAETVGGLVLAALFAGFLCAMLLFIALIEADHKTLLTLVAYNNLAPGAEELKRMEIIAGSRGTVSHDVTICIITLLFVFFVTLWHVWQVVSRPGRSPFVAKPHNLFRGCY